MKRFIPYVFLLTSSVLPASAYTPDSDGMYAVLDVTYFDPDAWEETTGEIVIQLNYPESPVTVANFVGLATGELPWYDFETQQIRGGLVNPAPFYDGLIFHRVVPNLIIQTGSRNGSGTDGPGWQIPNEADPGLNHIGGGVVSMANSSSGETNLNSGGSQFFITMAQFEQTQPQLDALNGKHSVFGFLREGIDLTQKINRNPLSGGALLYDATIRSITILKEGEGANFWDPSLYWVAPEFKESEFEITNNLENVFNDEDPFRVLVGRFNRYRDNEYYLQLTDDLDNWTSLNYRRGGIREDRLLEEDEDNRERRFLDNDLQFNNRSFYSLLESELPALPDWTGQRLTINFDPIEDLNEELDLYTPEVLTVDFYEDYFGGWNLKRSDSESLKPLGNMLQYQIFPIAHRDQVLMNFDFWTTMQTYLSYETPTSGSVYIYYTNPRPEGSTVTGTFTIGQGEPRAERQNKDGLQLILVITDTPEEGDPVISTYTINFWDNFAEEDFSSNFEGGYSLARSDTEFVQNGILIYEWFEQGGETHLLLSFDRGIDMQVLLNETGGTAGTAEVYLRSSYNTFFPAAFTTGVGEPRPNAIDKEGDKLVLNLDISGSDTELVTSTIDIDFYDNFEGGYEATRTDSEVNQFGEVLNYQWFETGGETRVDITYDIIQPMQVYLTFTSPTEGTATIHYPQFGQVGQATFVYTPGGGGPRPESLDKTGVQLQIELEDDPFDVLTINLHDDVSGEYSYTRNNDDAVPSGTLVEYQWSERQNGTDLVFLDFQRIPSMQVILNYEGENTGMAEVLRIDSGNVSTVPFTIGVAPPPRQSIDKSGVKLVVDLEDGSSINTTIDIEEFTFLTSTTGEYLRFRPNDGTPTSGQIVEYQWYEGDDFDQVNVAMDFLLDQQLFLVYETATTGKVAAYFLTGGNTELGTFTITNP